MFDFPTYYVPHVDVEIHHLETRKPLKFDKISLLEEGPLRASVLGELTYGKSIILVVVRSPLLSGLLL
jgi:alpha-mannosidase